MHAEFERRVADPVQTPILSKQQSARRGARAVTNFDLEQVCERYRQITSQGYEKAMMLANVDQQAADELERIEYELGLDADAIRQTLKARSSSALDLIVHPADEARAIIADLGFNAPEGSKEMGALIAAVRMGMEQGYARIGALAAGEALPTLLSGKSSDLGERSLTLADAVERYISVRKLPPKAESETKLALRQFEEAVGRKALIATTRADFHAFAGYLANTKVGGKTAGSVERTLSIHSIGKRVRMLSAAIGHAHDQGWFTGDNPALGLRLEGHAKNVDKARMPDKRRLQVHELNAIFAQPWFTGCRSATDTHTPGNVMLDGVEYWAPVMAAYTGCRAAELGGLRVSEVRLDHSHPHIIVRDNEYRRTKSKRMRCVPLLDKLRDLGFDDYFERIAREGHDRLFPDWTARKPIGEAGTAYPAWSNAFIIRAFNRTVIPSALGDTLPANARQEVTFHSMRGSFKAMLANTCNVPPNVVNEVIGHAKSELDARYVGEVTIEETYPIVRACNYDGLIIPPRK